MALLRRHSRPIADLLGDPQFPFMVGRLAGAAEMVSHHLQLSDKHELQEMGLHLAAVVDWFFDEQQKPLSVRTHASSGLAVRAQTEQVTEVMPAVRPD